jgi:hypothetical protein
MFFASERDTLSFVADVAVVADVTFVIGINLNRELPEHGRKDNTVMLSAQPRKTLVAESMAWQEGTVLSC